MKVSLFRDRKFAPFFWTQFLGAFNDNLFKNALVMLVTYKGVAVLGLRPESLVALAGGLFILPFFLLSPLAGQLADKYEKSRIIRITKLWEIVVMVVATLGFFLGSYMLLLLVLFLMGAQSTFFGPVKYSIIPDLVDEDHLVQGNAYIELGTFVAILLGTIAGGLCTTVDRPEWIISFGVLVVAGVGYLVSLLVMPGQAGAPNLKIQYNPVPELSELWKILREKPAIFNSVLGISWFWFFGAGILSVLPIYCKDFLGVDKDVVTLFLALFTLGIGIGSILAERFSFKRVEIGLVPIGSLGMTIFLIDLFLVSPDWQGAHVLSLQEFLSSWAGRRLVTDFGGMSIFGGLFIVPLYTLLQERSHVETRSRVIAGTNIFNALFMVMSSLVLMGLYHLNFKTPQIFLMYALLNLIVAFYIYSLVPEFTLRFYSWLLSHVLYDVRVSGHDHISKEGPALVISNHVTYVDWLIISASCNRPIRFIMYYKFFERPLLKWFFRQAKVIPIAGAKEDPALMDRAFHTVDRDLGDGELVGLFPEGRLTSDGELGPFKPGILKILQKKPVPVVPIVVRGLYGSIFSRAPESMVKWRRQILVEIHPPIPAHRFRLKDMEDFYRLKVQVQVAGK